MARRRGTSWQGAIKTAEKYHRYSFATEALAEDWEQAAREAVKAGLPVPDPTVINAEHPSLRVFYERNAQMIWPNNNLRSQDASQRACERFFGAETLMRNITTRKVHEGVSEMLRLKHRPSTINTRLSHLRVLLQYGKRLGIVEHSVEYPIQKIGDNSRLRFLTVDEETKVLNLFRHWGLEEHAQIIEALIDTGCRPSELLLGETKGDPVRWNEVSISAGGTAPDVNDPATGQPCAVLSLMRTKTGKYRVIPLTDRAKRAFLASREAGHKRPFGDMRTDTMSKTFREVVSFLDFDGEDVVLYTLRHTCASRLVQRGADLRRVMQWMGHTNINTTLRYAKLTPTDIFSLKDML